ncbi:MAG: NAD-dependent epimerase/dehydratase family protein [Candidatus Sericytochromatia bacterium]
MKLLIIGGTAFVGRHLVEAALGRGHAVTLFNRGQTNPGLFPEVDHLVGDRDGGLAALGSGEWDAVIDTCGYVPRVVAASAEALRDRVGRYVYVSSISVYDKPQPGADESSPLHATAPETEEVTPETYGPLKVLCERAVEAVYGDRCLITRPGIIAGPHDPTDRFTYCVKAMAGEAPVIIPEPRTAPVQVIDARDLAEWTLTMLEQGASGTYNAVGPAEPVSREGFLEAIRTRPDAPRVVWAPPEQLAAEGVEPGEAFSFWTPPEAAGFLALSPAKALQAGLTLRPLAETARDTLAWLAGEPGRKVRYGLEPAIAMRLAQGR